MIYIQQIDVIQARVYPIKKNREKNNNSRLIIVITAVND